MKTIYLIVLLSSFIKAQDFGYEYMMISEYRALGFSYNLQKFSPRSSNSLSDSNAIRFTTALPFVEFRQNNGRLAAGYQTFSTSSGKKKESFSVYGETHNDLALGAGRDQKASFVIPIIVAANYVRAEPSNNGDRAFDIGSLGLGTGLKFKHFERSFELQAFVIGTIYYSSEGFSTEYGYQNSIAAEVQCIIPELIYEGIIIGYRFESQRWNMNDASINYQRQYHGVFLGFLF